MTAPRSWGRSRRIEAALVLGFYVAPTVLIIRVRRVNLAVAAMVLTTMLIVALILESTVSEEIGGYAALGLLIAVVMVGLAVQFGAWAGPDDDVDAG